MVEAFTGTGGDSSTIVRLMLVDIGWDLFHQSPLIGVGIHNPSVYTYSIFGIENYYLHNNYIELLAGTGIIGVVTYYSMYVYLVYNMLRYHDLHSNEYVMVFILLMSQLVMDMGLVSYESKSYLLLHDAIFIWKYKFLHAKREALDEYTNNIEQREEVRS